jgi:hypothetical protein
VATRASNEKMKKLMRLIREYKNISFKEQIEKIGIEEHTRSNIFRNSSPAESWMIKRLYEVYPVLHDLEGGDFKKPKSFSEQLDELKDKILEIESKSNQMRIDLNQVRYILDKLIEDLRLLGEVQRIMYEGMKDPELRDVFAQWPEILAKFQSSIALPDEDLPGSDLPED